MQRNDVVQVWNAMNQDRDDVEPPGTRRGSGGGHSSEADCRLLCRRHHAGTEEWWECVELDDLILRFMEMVASGLLSRWFSETSWIAFVHRTRTVGCGKRGGCDLILC